MGNSKIRMISLTLGLFAALFAFMTTTNCILTTSSGGGGTGSVSATGSFWWETGFGGNTASIEGINIGVVGFGGEVFPFAPIDLNANTKGQIDGFIDGLEMNNGTALYYAMEQGADALAGSGLPENIGKVYMVTFTDGLDNASSIYKSSLDTVQNKIRTTTIKGKNITSYVIGVEGKDVKDTNKFKGDLNSLASGQEYTFFATDFNVLQDKFKEIAGNLVTEEKTQTLTCSVIRGVPDGTRVRWSLNIPDNASSPESQYYIEATYRGNNDTQQYSLENVNYVGVKTPSQSPVIQGTADGIFATFTFDEFKAEEQINSIVFFKQEGGVWQKDSETKDAQFEEVNVNKASIAVMLVLDCSTSLGDNFADVKTQAKGFIAALYGSMKQ
jgi:hypothetical protein